MNSIGNFQQKFVISVANPKNIVVFAFLYVLESFALFYGDFCIDLYSVASNEAMKRDNEALSASILSRVKGFMATVFS
jgi:hypothetical protein